MISAWRDTVERWGATADEIADSWPCDPLLARPDRVLYRALTVDAAPPTVFRWLCQLRVAPYSYDWLDNLGRRSPRTLTPGLEELAVGQRFMTIFTLADFAPDDHVTVRSDGPVFGSLAITYRVRPHPRGTRLAVKLLVRHARSPLGCLLRPVLPAADLVMMHKQLTNLASLSGASPPSLAVR